MFKIFALVCLSVLASCGGGSIGGGGIGGGSIGGGSADGENAGTLDISKIIVKSASISSSDKALIKVAKTESIGVRSIARVSSLVRNGGENNGQGNAYAYAYGRSNLHKVKNDGEIEALKFDVEVAETGVEQQSVELEVIKTKKLSDKYVAAQIADNRVLILDKDNGEVKDISGYNIDTFQVRNNYAYAVDAALKRIVRLRLDNETISEEIVLEGAKQAVDRDFTAIQNYCDLYNTATCVDYYADLHNKKIPGIDFIIGNDDIILSKVFITSPNIQGLSIRNVFIKDGNVYDSGSFHVFGHVGGGFSGGVIATADGTLYQLKLIFSDVAADAGDRLSKLTFGSIGINPNDGKEYWGVREEIVVQINNDSKVSSGCYAGQPCDPNYALDVNAEYLLTDTTRYFLTESGFYKTSDDGNNGISVTWTDLNVGEILYFNGVKQDASSLTLDKTFATLHDGKVFWKSSDNVIKMLELTAGATPVVFVSHNEEIKSFKVVANQVFFSTEDKEYLVRNAGDAPELQSIAVEEAISFN